jgi:hypothetical protein
MKEIAKNTNVCYLGCAAPQNRKDQTVQQTSCYCDEKLHFVLPIFYLLDKKLISKAVKNTAKTRTLLLLVQAKKR